MIPYVMNVHDIQNLITNRLQFISLFATNVCILIISKQNESNLVELLRL